MLVTYCHLASYWQSHSRSSSVATPAFRLTENSLDVVTVNLNYIHSLYFVCVNVKGVKQC